MLTSQSHEEPWVIPSVQRGQKEVWRTASQRAAYDRLEAICSIDPNAHYGNICPRTRAVLMTGPAGSGKTAVVRAYAALHGLPMFSQLASAYIPTGAIQVPTILGIRDFVRRNPKGGIVYFDECDKFCVGGNEARQSNWSQGIYGEVLSVLDIDSRLLALGWSVGDLQRFRENNFRIIASGAYQHVHKAARRAAKRGSLGFGAPGRKETYSDLFADDDSIPDELRFRFFGEVLHVDLPTREDFREALAAIHDECEHHEPISEALLDAAVESRRGVRWLESYLAQLLLTQGVEGPERHDEDEHEEQQVRHLSQENYSKLHAKLSTWIVSLRQAIFRYEAALLLALDRPSCSDAVCDLISDGWVEHPALLSTTRELTEALVPIEDHSFNTNLVYGILQNLSFATKHAVKTQAAGLQRAGLLGQTVSVREQCDRIEAVMKSLIGVEVS